MPPRPPHLTSAPLRPEWTRRQFLGAAAATTATVVLSRRTFALSSASASSPVSAPAAAGLVAAPVGRPLPLLESNVARPLRYTLADGAFRIRNGTERFNRPLYSALHDGRHLHAGDLPELRLAARSGHLRLALRRGNTAPRSLIALADIIADYRDGRMLYELRDEALLGRAGELRIELHTPADASGLHLVVTGRRLPPQLTLLWAFAGTSSEPPASPDAELVPGIHEPPLQPDACAGQRYTLYDTSADLVTPSTTLALSFPPNARLHLAPVEAWNSLTTSGDADASAAWQALAANAPPEAATILTGSLDLSPGDLPPQHITIRPSAPTATSLDAAFAARREQLAVAAARVRTQTPEPWLDAAVRSLNLASGALWSAPTGSLLSSPSGREDSGWATPMALDALGEHARVRDHLRHWIARQNTGLLPPGTDPDGPVAAPADPGSALTRKSTLLHTNGDLSASDSDPDTGDTDTTLNLFEAFIRHLRWTGDLAFAHEAWPALLRHMDRQYRLFRREFADPTQPAVTNATPLPLYESYASLTLADAQPGNGAGFAHSSARNLFLNRATAELARVLNEDAVPFDAEATLIHTAMLRLLWQSDRGCFAEAKDSLFPQTLSPSPGLWTTARVLDAECTSAREAWQITAAQLAALGRIPVHGEGLPGTPGEAPFLLRSSDWLLAGDPARASGSPAIRFADNAHMALALWQANQPDAAFALLRGSLLDSAGRGLVPGNLHTTSALDPLAGETGIDHGDSLGLFARAVVEGLFGVLPDLLRATLTIRPGFPADWTAAELHHPEIDLIYARDGLHETLHITSRLPHPVALTLLLPALTTADPVVLANGAAYPSHFDPNSTGRPRLVLTDFPAATEWKIEIRWHGKPPLAIPAPTLLHAGDPVPLPRGASLAQVDDPQGCLSNGLASTPGHHAVFLRVVEEKCGFWLPIPLEILPASSSAATATPEPTHFEPLALGPALNSHLTDIFRRSYTAPRSPFCSLALPEHLLGSASNQPPIINDAGLRAAGGLLRSAYGIPFLTPAKPSEPNCRFLSFWNQDRNAIDLTLSGRATALHLLMTGTTFPRVSHALHGSVTVRYIDGTESRLTLTPPGTWWPIERDLFLDDFVFRATPGRPLPPRVDLRTGVTRILDLDTFKGQGRPVPGGAATILHLPLDPTRTLASLRVECHLYGIVLALLAATLSRPAAG